MIFKDFKIQRLVDIFPIYCNNILLIHINFSLWVAEEYDHFEVANYLVSKGADLSRYREYYLDEEEK